MAGPGKGKKKKNKGKSDNVHSLGNKQHATASSSEFAMESWTPETIEKNNRMMEELIMEKVELIYKIALERLLDLGYGMEAATRAILISGSIFGGTNILSNILSNTLATITKQHETTDDHTIEIQPIFQDIRELARFSMQTLINLIVQDQSNTTKMDAIISLMQSDCLAVSSHSEGHKDEGNEKGTSDVDIGRMLKENTTCLQKLSIRVDTLSSSSSRRQVATFGRSESSSDAFESDHTLEFLKSITNCPDGMSLEDWLRTCEEGTEDDICSSLAEKIKELQIQVKERREWARKTVIEAAKRFNAAGMEVKDLRMAGKGILGLIKQKEALESCNAKIIEREKHLRNVNHDLGIVNQVKSILEAKNQEYKSEIVAHNLSISESQKSHLEAHKNERKTLKKCKDTEKQIQDIKRLIGEEKQKLAEMAQRMEQVNNATEQAKLRLRQGKEAKEQAHALLLEEKRINKLGKENSKKIMASLRRELDMKYRQLVDEQNRLEVELSQLKAQESSNASSSSAAVTAPILDDQNRCAQRRNFRQCIICKKGEVSVLFLPCAHQVICSECSDEVYDALEDHCPCCKTPIVKRVKVYGPSP